MPGFLKRGPDVSQFEVFEPKPKPSLLELHQIWNEFPLEIPLAAEEMAVATFFVKCFVCFITMDGEGFNFFTDVRPAPLFRSPHAL